ncbi:hypothetical protein MVES1_001226 [Malassezia vespertilionis]|uniref:Sodium/calcium exchanger membrane region domain-containing protein n=1 Tax=Malassezia vespertilionis TaxID=2020962 RepID=A0A2N1JDU8_9BASI|nr:uncharacterized protein MVES1_001226 [Malassezia vespertilionis]PKI84735.1 hypothetical protein MVES_001156 [Malassezia vespertilionis]WFD05892.1 hypothetical protein MVES1_001226 [Malassezia vespertilionis]
MQQIWRIYVLFLLIVCTLPGGLAHASATSVLEECQLLPPLLRGVDACRLIEQQCSDSASFFYLKLYYCVGAEENPAHVITQGFLHLIAVAGIGTWLLFLFSAMGVVANDFFCPNLSALASNFGLSDSTVGVTFLAFGNGFPDVISTFRAMQKNAGSMAIGELMGAAVFTVSIVCGSIMVFYSFHIHPFVLLRDVGVYALAVGMTLYFLHDTLLGFQEGLIMAGIYVLFIVLVVFGNAWSHEPRADTCASEHAPLLGRGNGASPGASDADIQTAPHVIKHSLVTAMDLHDFASSMHRDRFRPDSPLLPSISTDIAEHMLDPAHHFNTSPARSTLFSRHALRRSNSHDPIFDAPPPVPHRASSPNFEFNIPSIRVQRPSLDLTRPPLRLHRVLLVAFFPSLMHWEDKSTLNRVIGLLCLPAVSILRLTVPLINTEEFIMHEALSRVHHAMVYSPNASPTPSVIEAWDALQGSEDVFLADPSMISRTHERAVADRLLIGLQYMVVPPFILWVLEIPSDAATRNACIVLGALFGTIAGVVHVRKMAREPDANGPQQLQRFASVRSVLGFFVGLLWIIVSVDQILAVLRTFAYVYGWSEAILGLTLFAMGNSLGDVVTNLSIARLGHPLMAFSACFASPLTNLLIGVSFSVFWTQLEDPSHGPYFIPHSIALTLSSYVLLGMLLLLLIVLPLHQFQASKRLGILFLFTYGGTSHPTN